MKRDRIGVVDQREPERWKKSQTHQYSSTALGGAYVIDASGSNHLIFRCFGDD